jgi:hypothetical protein
MKAKRKEINWRMIAKRSRFRALKAEEKLKQRDRDQLKRDLQLADLRAESQAMLDALCRALEQANNNYEWVYATSKQKGETIIGLRKERNEFCNFMAEIDIILTHHSVDSICGSKWIAATALLNARKRYAEAV